MLSSLVLRLFLTISIWALHVAGQNSVLTYNWKFESEANPVKIPRCHPFNITVFPNPKNSTAGTYSGTPPYYMMAFPEGGQPLTQHIGDTKNSLSWTPTHPVGTQFSLQLTDAITNTGGAGGNVFEVVANSQGQDCAAPTPPQNFSISSNITGGGQLETCKMWRLNVNGGIPPYTVTLNAMNSPVLTNITVDVGSDAVVFCNRADPNTVLFAAVVDSTGLWANGTQWISTFGSTDVNCTGFRTIVTTQDDLNKQEKALEKAKEQAEKTHRTVIIVAVVVSVVGSLVIGGALGAWIHRRRKIAESLKPDIEPRQFMDSGPSGQVLSVTQFTSSSPGNTPSPGKKAFSPIASLPYAVEPFNDIRRESATDQTQTHSSGHDPRAGPSFASFPRSSVRGSGKGREAAQDRHEPDGTVLSYPPNQSSSSGSHPPWPTRSASLGQQHSSMVSSVDNEIIFQHRDAGQVVRELPPPYIPPQMIPEDTGDERRRSTEA